MQDCCGDGVFFLLAGFFPFGDISIFGPNSWGVITSCSRPDHVVPRSLEMEEMTKVVQPRSCVRIAMSH